MTAQGIVISRTHSGAIPSSNAPQPGSTSSGFPGTMTTPMTFTGSGFFTQLKSTIQRQLLQKRRKWRSCAVEMLLPILFVLGLMAISSASTRTDVPAKQYISPTGPQELGKMIRSQHLCYNPRTANAELVGLLQPCSNVSASTLTCLQQSPNLPVSGLCITSGLDGIQALALSISNAEQDMEMPNYNEYVLMKWALSGLPDSDDFLRQSGQIYVTPQSIASTSFVKYMNETFSLFNYTFGGYFNSRQDATAFSTDVSNEGKTWAIIGINQADSNGLDFVLSMNRTAQVGMVSRNRFVNGLGGKTYAKYVASGALTLQKSVNDYYITKVLNSNAVETYPVGASSHTVVAPMPNEKYVDDEFLSVAASLGPLLLVLAFLYPVSQLAKRLVEEKEQRLREGTMIMGLSKRAFFASWLLVYYVQMAIVSFVIAILISSSIATQSNFLIIFIPYLLFSLTTVNLSALLSTLFAKSKIAALCVPLLYFVFAIPAFSLSQDSSPAIFSLLSFLCPVPFSLALKLIFSYEINNGLGWNSAFSSTDEPYNIAVAIVFLCVDFVLYFALMAYLDMVIPKEWGTTKHPLFFIMKFFRKKEAHDDNVAHQVDGGIDNPKNHLTKIGRLSALQDYPLPNERSTVHIRQLRKEFPGAGGRVNVAVDGMELRMFPDTVTVFLGHNGAGKTTVMNMMTGMLSPTSGDVTIYGNSILTNLQAVRRDIGFCPQHNILWDDLTCMEHLQYFARLKGMKGADVDNESIEMLTKVDLLDKKDVFSANLSGGQKRKLSVAIAFMGKARLVLLDEPTAGMDVAARRHTWDVLKEMSKGRTILLTTHFMDEADLLGSRIAIMSKGSLNSYGSPMYLKNNLGSGYVMRLAASSMIADPQPILAEIRRIIPSAHIREAKGQEVAISLPKDAARLFPSVIRTMDAAATKARLNYNSISLSVASLEDVFLAIAHQEATDGAVDAEESAAADEAKVAASFAALEKVYLKVQQQQQMLGVAQERKNNSASNGANFSSAIEMQSISAAENNSRPLTVGSSGTFGRQLSGMLMKRINHGRRDYCSLCLQIAAPLFCIFIALVLGRPSGGSSDPGQTFYSNKELYGSAQQVISTNNCSSTSWDSDFASVDSQYLPSTLNFSNHLLSTFNSHGDRERMVSFSCNDNFANTVLMVNSTGSFTAPQALNQYYRNVARQVSSGKATITVSQWPLPSTERETAGTLVYSHSLHVYPLDVRGLCCQGATVQVEASAVCLWCQLRGLLARQLYFRLSFLPCDNCHCLRALCHFQPRLGRWKRRRLLRHLLLVLTLRAQRHRLRLFGFIFLR